ncbi:MAG TPA: LacI family DNA-binding transcriptional regulator [Propionibacteriaceae bacterium]|nr:LacI family DNA-binding transcriptional regulator [Propionibacteriaceae bacterium]
MVDVARQAGVSQKTVSRVVNGAPHVRPEVRDRVLAVISELGYRPNVAARALVTQRTHVIGVLAVGLPLFGPALRVLSLEHGARRRGYELALASLPDTSSAGIRSAIDSLLARGVEGIVLEIPSHLVDIDETALRGVPIATSVGRIAGVRRQVVVDTLQADIGRLATEHLLGLGHETVFHVSGPADWDASRRRREGWSAALAAAGRRQPEVLTGDWSAGSGYAHGQRLAARPDVTAIFAANDSQAMGVMRALAEAGRTVPGDVSVVGVDDVPEAEFQMVPLTTVRSDQAATADRVLSELVALIEGREPVSGAPLTRELVVRSSTAPPPASPAALRSERPLPVEFSSHSPSKEGTHV